MIELSAIPPDLLEKVRGALGVEDPESDGSRDDEIQEMSKDEFMEHIFQWEIGDSSWWSQVKEWAEGTGITISTGDE